MAETKRNSRTTAKRQASSGTKKKAQSRKQEPKEELIREEVVLIASFAVAVLLFLSNFHLCGVAGDYLRKMQLGIFGTIGFVAPVLLFIGVCFGMSNQGNPAAFLKMAAALLGIFALCGLMELVFGIGYREGQTIMDIFTYSSENGWGGGIIGGLLVQGLGSLVGTVGTCLLLIVLLAICCVCITEKSLVELVKREGEKAYQYARRDVGRRRQIHEEKQKHQKEQQRIRGVNLNSTKIPYEEEPEWKYSEDEYPYEEKTDSNGKADSGNVSEEQRQEDIFTGKISLPPEYIDEEEEIDIPFDEDDVRIVEEALQAVWQNTAYEAAADVDQNYNGKNRSETPKSGEKQIFPCQEEPIPETITHWIPEPSSQPEVLHKMPEPKPADKPKISKEKNRAAAGTGKNLELDTKELKKKPESKRKEVQKKKYQIPSITLLKRGSRPSGAFSEQEYKDTAIRLQQTLKNFGVGVTVTNISCGPSVTRYELKPEQGVKVSKIVGLADDIKLSLAAADIRIEAPIPGRSAVGIEVPNKENTTVYLREIFESEDFKKASSRLSFAVGKDIGGQVVVADIATMPHLLIAGATGSGKSVCINTLIMSILFKSSPDDVKMIMIDPKVVELSAYNGIPHLLIPVVTDTKKASGALNWAVGEMMSRYDKFAKYNVRNLKGYNAKAESAKSKEDEDKPQKMPQIIIIIDELADLMMVSPGEVEEAICRLAQLARAAGIHLVIATQRPSVNVITGLIKANIPSRIAFEVSSGVDSRTIIDMYGAEKLLGKGDMLFYPSGIPKPQRVQGAFVSDQEVAAVVEFLSKQEADTDYQPDIENNLSAPMGAVSEQKNDGRDEYFEQAGKFIIEKDKASIGMLQRMYKIGFNRASRIMDQLEDFGVVGEEEGTKPRKVLMTIEEFENLLSQE